MTLLGLVLDILLIAMLGVMIFFVMRLHNRLEVLRRGKTDLEGLLQNLINSTSQAERSLQEMRGTAGDLSVTLQKQVAGAASAREELEFLLSSADKMADTLVNHISAARTIGGTAAEVRETKPQAPVAERAPAAATVERAAPTLSVPPRDEVAPAPAATTRESAERDLLRAIEKLR